MREKIVLTVVLVFLAALSAQSITPARADTLVHLDEIAENNETNGPIHELLLVDRQFVEGKGTYFEITNSEYLNIALTSSEAVYVVLESVRKMISFIIESHSSVASTVLSFTGFQPNTTYYRYQDGSLMESFATDSDGYGSYVQDTTSPHHICIVENVSTIYIRPDGTVYSDTGQPVPISVSVVDGVYTYTFTGNISESIVVQKSNIVIDGNGYTLQGSGSGNGFYASGISGMTIKNVVVRGWEYGIVLYRSSGNEMSGNTINNTLCGIKLQRCSGDNVSGNTIQNNTFAIFLRERSNGYNFSGNTINNNGGGIYLRNSSGTISGNVIINNTEYGIHLDWCKGNGNNISGNTINENNLGGISLVGGSSSNNFSGNTIQNNSRNGIVLWGPSGNNTISGNTIENNNGNGIYLPNSNGNSILGNTINNNGNGIVLLGSSGNIVYHNNIIANSRQAIDTNPATNDWHHPDSLEGNYWSDYPGVDDGSGTGKHAVADDGIGDTHIPWPGPDYDNYPLMYPWCSPTGHTYALIRDVRAMGLEPRVERKLVAVLQRAIQLSVHSNKKGSSRALIAFVTKVNIYERLRKLTPAQADELRAAAYEIIELI